ncbi:GGDEF domain-containing phosphodiesterase [Synechococcus sp. CCAP 1479/9]|uniref:putative bifunctional diguanylate cyclase/phosphodiesterase n=1 Tax=Synechococcus sp. CCAP 1479/9 TaxID=1221593 RepID=UPI001C210171|nr:GGDEF domain-containing phosphodiesterase [Synechococcus sp. CCAP 1479/9]
MAIGALGTALLTWSSVHQTITAHRNREQPAADLVVAALHRKLDNTESLLRGLVGLQMASQEVTLAELQRYVASLESDGRSLEGIGTLGFATAAAGQAPIRLVAPMDPGSRALLGSDLWSWAQGSGKEPDRETAPPEGWLLPGRPRPGEPAFLVQILPFGSSPGTAAPGSPPARRWAFATLPLRDVVRAALNHPLVRLHEPVDLQLYIGDRADPAQLLYDSRNLPEAGVLPHALSRRIDTGGERWLLLVQVPLHGPSDWLPSWVAVLLLGLTTSLLAALLTRELQRRRQRAEQEGRSLGELRSQLEESLQWLHLHRRACSLVQEGIVVTDRGGAILACNEAYVAITGYPEEELVGRNPRMMNSGYQSTAFYADLWKQLLASDRWEGEIWNRRRSGEVYPVWMRMAVVRDSSGEPSHYIAALADLSVLREKDRQLEYLGFHDPLTRLPNLQMAELRLGQLCQQAQPLVVIWIELDGIKRIEESFGQAKGDQLVQLAVDRLGHFVGPVDVMAQVGRGEFLIVHALEATGPTALESARSLMAALTDPKAPGGMLELTLSAWAGISCFPQDSQEPESLLLFASTALAQARRQGPQAVQRYAAEMTVRSRHRLAIEAHLQRAMDAGQLELFYQPQVDGQGTLLGAEALLRWRSPTFGSVSPLEFLPIAEASDLIHRIGEWVLKNACRQWQLWVEAGFEPGRLAVNLSSRQFQDSRQTVPDMVQACLSHSGLDVKRLELEITESCLMPALGTREQLLNLESMGVELAIDDFGTGFSSLSTIHNFPVHKLKIDRSFVDGVDGNPTSQSIVRATLAMAEGLGVNVLAEGVERPEELDFLIRCGCPAFQGYLFSRPLSAEAFEELLRRGARLGPVAGGEPAAVPLP